MKHTNGGLRPPFLFFEYYLLKLIQDDKKMRCKNLRAA